MRAEDCAAVAQLTSQLGYPAGEGDIKRRFGLIVERDGGQVFIAETGEVVVGWVHVHASHLLEADARAEIGGLVVAESARRSGVGRLLMEEAEAWARARHLNVVSLRSNVLRVDAHAFYERLGYQVVKNQKAFRKTLVNPPRARSG